MWFSKETPISQCKYLVMSMIYVILKFQFPGIQNYRGRNRGGRSAWGRNRY